MINMLCQREKANFNCIDDDYILHHDYMHCFQMTLDYWRIDIDISRKIDWPLYEARALVVNLCAGQIYWQNISASTIVIKVLQLSNW